MIPNRIGRLELLLWWAGSILGGGALLAIVAALANTPVKSYPLPLPQAFALIAVSILMLKAALSRLHDIGWPGWSILLMFIPLVNLLTAIVLTVIPGQDGENLYGAPSDLLERLRRTTRGHAPD